MRMRIAAVVLAGGLAFALGGCATPSPMTATGSPQVFTSADQALAAAKDAYVAYSEMADAILADGGAKSDRIDSFVTGELLTEEHDGSRNFAVNGYHAHGSSTLKSFTLEFANLKAAPNSKRVLAAYVCVDVSDVDVLDASGQSVVSATRPPLAAYEVTFDLVDSRLLPSAQEPWNNGGVCA